MGKVKETTHLKFWAGTCIAMGIAFTLIAVFILGAAATGSSEEPVYCPWCDRIVYTIERPDPTPLAEVFGFGGLGLLIMGGSIWYYTVKLEGRLKKLERRSSG